MNHSQKAYVLHSRPYRENQQFVDLLTEFEGKVSALVYVGQSKRSIKKGLLQPFLPIEVMLKDSGKIKTINQVDSRGKSLTLVKHSLYSAFYVNELLIRLLSEQIACQPLFDQYHLTIIALAQGQPIAPELRHFELALLAELGQSFDFSPVFEHSTAYFIYKTEEGFVPAYDTSSQSKRAAYFKSKHLKIIAQQVSYGRELTITEMAEIELTFKLLMRQVINQLFCNKPLNSRRLFVQT
jgi:DNA repair protein RecO (recombination protein O)